jgi:tetratricopeptide (TPR) repeat protein
MSPFYECILIITITAAFGGFVHGMLQEPKIKYSIVNPFSGVIEFGFFGDILVGVAAGISIFFIMDSLFGLNPEALTKNDQALLRLVALGVICGYMGSSVLNNLVLVISKRLVKAREELEAEQEELQRLRDRVKSASRARHLISLAAAYRRWKRFDDALNACAEAIDLDRTIADYYLEKSFVYAEQDDYKNALEMADKAIEIDKTSARAYYDRACYKHKMTRKEEAFRDLKESIRLDGLMRKMAIYDPDFDDLREDEGFKKLVGASSVEAHAEAA